MSEGDTGSHSVVSCYFFFHSFNEHHCLKQYTRPWSKWEATDHNMGGPIWWVSHFLVAHFSSAISHIKRPQAKSNVCPHLYNLLLLYRVCLLNLHFREICWLSQTHLLPSYSPSSFFELVMDSTQSHWAGQLWWPWVFQDSNHWAIQLRYDNLPHFWALFLFPCLLISL